MPDEGVRPDAGPATEGDTAPPTETSGGGRPGRRRRTGLVVGSVVGAVVLVVVGVVLVLVRPADRPDVLDARAVERGVSGVVTTDWHRGIVDTRCPDDQPARAGTAFTCTATVDGRPQSVPVRVVDDAGTYEVGQPR